MYIPSNIFWRFLLGQKIKGNDINTCRDELTPSRRQIQKPIVESSMEPESSTRHCEHCHLEYPLHEFRRRSRHSDKRVSQCRRCHNQSELLRYHRKAGHLKNQEYRKHLTTLKNQRTERGVERIYQSLIGLCGGADGLLERWADAMEKDFKAGGLKAHRHIAAIIRLMQYHEAQQHQRTDYSTMSDEELLELMKVTLLNLP